MADINLVLITGVSTKDAQLRRKAADQQKAEFSFQVDRPFDRPDGTAVSDLFLVDVWGDLATWAADNIRQGTRLMVIGTLNKESFRTRTGGKEHLTVVKAKCLVPLNGVSVVPPLDVEVLRDDGWEREQIVTQLQGLIARLEESARPADKT